MHRSLKMAVLAAIALSAPPLAFAAVSGAAANPGDVAAARKCESLLDNVAMHSKECIALGRNSPELFSDAYRSRMNISETPAPASVAPVRPLPPSGKCSNADHAHGHC